MGRTSTLFLLLLLTILSIRSFLFASNKPQYKDNQKIRVATQITSEPIISGKTQRFRIALDNGMQAFVTTSKFPEYFYGQDIHAEGELTIQKKESNAFISLFYPKIEEVEKQNSFFAFNFQIRKKARELYSSFLSPDQSALLLGIVLGVKEQMTSTFQDNVRSAGVMHVIAASGMNVTMLAGALYFILTRLLSRRKALFVSCIGAFFYAMIAGFEPSIVRASLMAGLTFLAGILGKQKHALFLLGLSGSLMLFIQPYLISDIGFQLSFLATLGIILLKPLLPQIAIIKSVKVFQEDLYTTLAAQLATLPILLSNFGSVNLLSVFINMLVLWTIPFLMVIGGVSLLIGFILEPLGKLLILPAIPFLWFFEQMIFLASFVAIPLQFESWNIFLYVGYYLFLLAILLKPRVKHEE